MNSSATPAAPRSYDAARRAALDTPHLFEGVPKSKRSDHFNRALVLHRLFANQPDGWLLKGASALLWRDSYSRETKDLDLCRLGAHDVLEAVEHLRAALETPSTPPSDVRFDVALQRPPWSPDGGVHHVATVAVGITDRQGSALSHPVKIDVVIGTGPVGMPETVPSHDLSAALRCESQDVRLYPVTDHLADKISATFQRYGDRPSTRIRDLVDIVYLSERHSFRMSTLWTALESLRAEREAPPYPKSFSVPKSWEKRYPVFREKKAPQAPETFIEAFEQAQAFLDPVLAWDGDGDFVWTENQWRPEPRSASAPTASPR